MSRYILPNNVSECLVICCQRICLNVKLLIAKEFVLMAYDLLPKNLSE
jgi:hypothetical protein